MGFLDSLEPWQRLAIVLGVVATALSIAGRIWKWPIVRGVVRLGQRAALWGFRKALIHILTSDSREARAHVVYLIEPEIERLEKIETHLTTLRQNMRTLSELVYTDRNVLPDRIAKLEHTMDRMDATMEKALFDIREMLHTIAGVVLGAEALKKFQSDASRS